MKLSRHLHKNWSKQHFTHWKKVKRPNQTKTFSKVIISDKSYKGTSIVHPVPTSEGIDSMKTSDIMEKSAESIFRIVLISK